jgi:hypothetical protein
MLGSKLGKTNPKPDSIKEAAVGRLPQKGRTAPQPALFVGILYGGWLWVSFSNFAAKQIILYASILGCKS